MHIHVKIFIELSAGPLGFVVIVVLSLECLSTPGEMENSPRVENGNVTSFSRFPQKS
jgi:hypothetical protein